MTFSMAAGRNLRLTSTATTTSSTTRWLPITHRPVCRAAGPGQAGFASEVRPGSQKYSGKVIRLVVPRVLSETPLVVLRSLSDPERKNCRALGHHRTNPAAAEWKNSNGKFFSRAPKTENDMTNTIEKPTRRWYLKPSTPYSTRGTTSPPAGSGRPTTFNTAAHIPPDATASSIWSRAPRLR